MVFEDAVRQALTTDGLVDEFDVGRIESAINWDLISAIAGIISPGLEYASTIASKIRKAGPDKKLESALLFGSSAADHVATGSDLMTVLNERNAGQELSPRQLTSYIKDVYVKWFDSKKAYIANLNSEFFTGIAKEQPLVSSFMDSLVIMEVPVNKDIHPVAAILGSGVFSSPNPNDALKNAMEDGFAMAKAQMIGALLAAQGVILFGNTNPDRSSCQGPHDQWDGNVCLEFRRTEMNGRDLVSSGVDPSVIGRLGDHGIDIREMMLNIKECRNRYDEAPADNGSGFESNYPECWFAMPYFEADDAPSCVWPPPKGFNYRQCRLDPPPPPPGGGRPGIDIII